MNNKRAINSDFTVNKPILVFSAVAAFLFLAGMSLKHTHSLASLVASPKAAFLMLVSFFVLTTVIAVGTTFVFRWFGTCKLGNKSVRRRYFLVVFAVLIFAWLPYIIIFAPGSPCYDLVAQLRQFDGLRHYSTHHPLISTFIYGAVFSLGRMLGGASSGLLAIVIMQTLAYAIALTFEIYILHVLRAPKSILVASVLFFALCPAFGSYCQWCVKDSLFVAFFTVYVTLFVCVAVNPSYIMKSPKYFFAFACIAILTGLTRNNGMYIVVLSLPFLTFLLPKEERRQTFVLFVLICVCIPGVNMIAQAGTQAKYGSVREMLSIPFQQTARYVLMHDDEVTPEEEEAIDAVLDYKTLAESYNWRISDPVKDHFKGRETLSHYVRVYIHQGLKHPETYLDALAEHTYGYWHLDPRIEEDPPMSNYCGYGRYDWVPNPYGWQQWTSSGLQSNYLGLLSFLRSTPIVQFIFYPALYVWILFLAIAYLVYKKQSVYLILFLPSLILLLTCFAGPVSGSMRYALGLAATAPLCLWVALFFGNKLRDS